MCENDVAFVSFLWSITVKPGPKRDRSQWTTMAVVGFYSFLVCLSINVCVRVCVLQVLLMLRGPRVTLWGHVAYMGTRNKSPECKISLRFLD